MTKSFAGLRPLVLPLFLPALMSRLGSGLLVPILPLYAAGFEISYGLIGLVLAGEGLGTLIADVPTGMMQRRFGNKQVMMAGFAVITAAVGLLFFAQSVWIVLLLRLFAGFGRAMVSVSMHIYIANQVKLSQRGKAISMFGGTHRLGGLIGPALGGIIAGVLGFQAAFLVMALATGVGLIFAALFMHSSPREDRKHGEGRHHLRLMDVLRAHHRVLASAGVAQVFGQMIRAGRAVVIPIYAADALGLGVDQIGFIVSLSAAVDFSLFLVAGWLMDRYGRKFAIVPCFSIQALGMALVPLTAGFGGLLFAAVVIGFGNGLGAGSMMTLGADLSPVESRGEFLGLWRLISDTGFTGAPLVIGTVADILALGPAIWVIAGSGLAAASIFLFFVPETLKHKQLAAAAP